MLSRMRYRLLLACLLSLALGMGRAVAQPLAPLPNDQAYDESDTFAQPFDSTPPSDTAGEEPYAPDDTYAPNDSYAPDGYAPEGEGETGDDGAVGQYGYTEADFTGNGYGGMGAGLERAHIPEHGAPEYWLPEPLLHFSPCNSCVDPWFVHVEAVMMHRNRARAVLLSTRTNTVNISGQLFSFETKVMDSKKGTFPMAPGTRVTLGRYLGKDYIGRDHTLEFSYLWLREWRGNDEVAGTRLGPVTLGPNTFTYGELNSPFSPTGSFIGSLASGFSNADYHAEKMRSQMYNFELNWRIRRGERRSALVAAPDGSWSEDYTPSYTPSMLFGIRYMNFEDEFHFLSRGVINTDGVDQPFSGQYDVNTNNQWLGVQSGLEIRYQWRRFSCAVQGKYGIYGTSSNQHSAIMVNDDTTLHNGIYPDTNQQFAYDTMGVGFIGELNLLMRYRLSSNWTVRAGYDFNWVNGLALAPEQMTFTDPPNVTVNHGGALLIQGARVGLELFW